MLIVQLFYLTVHVDGATDSRVADHTLSASTNDSRAALEMLEISCAALPSRHCLPTSLSCLFDSLTKTHSVTDLFNVASCQGK